jgi:hypothetical protein
MTKLIEFKNHKGEVLRGLLDKTNSSLGVVCVHGFERTTVEYRFKNILDKMRGRASFFRFDFSGCGMSDGSFKDMRFEKQSKELEAAIAVFKKHCPKIKKLVFLAHSFGCCVALGVISQDPKNTKAVFFGPALNQKELQRFWFAASTNPGKEITWENFRSHFSEKKFLEWMKKPLRTSKAHLISSKYFMENGEADYRPMLSLFYPSKILIVHGDKDDKVPLKSNLGMNKKIKIIKIKGGDHDLQRMDMVSQYILRVVDFIRTK